MQVDDVDCYGPSHVVMTSTIEEMDKDSLYITLPRWIKFSVIKDDYKEKKGFVILNEIKPLLLYLMWIKSLQKKNKVW